MTGGAAAIIFPSVKSLEPVLPGYPDYTGEHWRLAAGFVAARIFALSDIVQFVCAVVTGATLLIVAASADVWRARIATFLRLSAFGAALLLLAYNFFLLAPRMNTNLDNYWTAAETGDNEAALDAQQAFMRDHGPATRTMAGTMVATLLLTGIGVAAVASSPQDKAVGPRNSRRGNTGEPRLQPPDLLRGAKR